MRWWWYVFLYFTTLAVCVVLDNIWPWFPAIGAGMGVAYVLTHTYITGQNTYTCPHHELVVVLYDESRKVLARTWLDENVSSTIHWKCNACGREWSKDGDG